MVNWYPGHMAKAKKRLKNDLNLVDLVIELLDARIPMSSRNPQLDELLDEQKRVIVLNKKDLALPEISKHWIDYFSKEAPTRAVNAKDGVGMSGLIEVINNVHQKVRNKAREKGRKERPIRIMVIGIPNVGKSALINSLAGQGSAKTGDKPGVTRGKQWIKVDKNIELLDTPGILWPDIESDEVSYKLALTGAVDQNRIDRELIAYQFVKNMVKINPSILEDQYDIHIGDTHPYDVLDLIGKRRGCLMSGGRIDKERVSKIILQDYRKGQFGRISLERPEEEIE